MLEIRNQCLKLIIVLGVIAATMEISVDEFLNITEDQKNRLDQFRQLVGPIVPQDYMKKDVYLIRWLREKKFNVADARSSLLDHLKWRSVNHMDTILEEDWTDFDANYRVHVQGCDKEGKPVVSVDVGEWDVRRSIITGEEKRMMRFFDKIFEEASTVLRAFEENGENGTQATIIFDFRSFNLALQACGRCLPVYFHMLGSSGNYPGFLHRVIAINVPQIALPIWEIFKGLMTEDLRKVISIHGRNKKSWQSFLLKEIDKDNLTIELGGTREEAPDAVFLRTMSTSLFRCGSVHMYPSIVKNL